MSPVKEEPGLHGPLPDAVRARVVGYASETLGAMKDDDVPASLKTFRRWAPAHRTKRAATPLAAAVERDVVFRQRVFARVREELPDLAEVLNEGEPPLGRRPGRRGRRGLPRQNPRVGRSGRRRERPAGPRRRRRRLGPGRAGAGPAAREASRPSRWPRPRTWPPPRPEAEAARAEAATVSRSLREEKGARRRAEKAVAAAEESAAAVRAEAADTVAAAEAEVSRARSHQAEAEAALGASRKAVRDGRAPRTPDCDCCWTRSSTGVPGTAPRAGAAPRHRFAAPRTPWTGP